MPLKCKQTVLTSELFLCLPKPQTVLSLLKTPTRQIWAMLNQMFLSLTSYGMSAQYLSSLEGIEHIWAIRASLGPALDDHTSVSGPHACNHGAQSLKDLASHPYLSVSLALHEFLQEPSSPSFPLSPVGAGTVVEHLSHILSLAQVSGGYPIQNIWLDTR